MSSSSSSESSSSDSSESIGNVSSSSSSSSSSSESSEVAYYRVTNINSNHPEYAGVYYYDGTQNGHPRYKQSTGNGHIQQNGSATIVYLMPGYNNFNDYFSNGSPRGEELSGITVGGQAGGTGSMIISEAYGNYSSSSSSSSLEYSSSSSGFDGIGFMSIGGDFIVS
jgi:hypothetical protein